MHSQFKTVRVWLNKHFSKGLLLGIVLSVFLHFMMMTALFENHSPNLNLPSENALLIDAILVKPKLKPATNVKEVKPQPEESAAPSDKPNVEALPSLDNHNASNNISDAVESPTDAPPVMLNDANVDNNANALSDDSTEQTQDESLVSNSATEVPIPINPYAYQYVETYFDVRTDINATPQANPAGNAKIVFQLTQNNTQYQIESSTAPKGFAALFMANLTQKSVGNFTEQGLQPLQYDYQFGDKPDKTYRATFDWEREKLMMTTIKGTQVVNLTNGAQDLLSFMYQLMYVPPLNNLQFNITNGKKFALYSYLFEGEELVETKMGALNTIHIARENDDHDEKTDVWLATDYQHLPVKIRKTEKNGKVYELLATKILTKAN